MIIQSTLIQQRKIELSSQKIPKLLLNLFFVAVVF